MSDNISLFKIGDKVHYTSPNESKENGIVKRVAESGMYAWVVYECNQEWDKYFNYNSACTNIDDLTKGWI